MPLSAAFHFFSPFHSKKKYHIQNSFSSFLSSSFHFLFSLFISISHPSFLAIFVILLLLLKDNKILGDLRVNRPYP